MRIETFLERRKIVLKEHAAYRLQSALYSTRKEATVLQRNCKL